MRAVTDFRVTQKGPPSARKAHQILRHCEDTHLGTTSNLFAKSRLYAYRLRGHRLKAGERRMGKEWLTLKLRSIAKPKERYDFNLTIIITQRGAHKSKIDRIFLGGGAMRHSIWGAVGFMGFALSVGYNLNNS